MKMEFEPITVGVSIDLTPAAAQLEAAARMLRAHAGRGCESVANLKGEHIACDVTAGQMHTVHGNQKFGLIWADHRDTMTHYEAQSFGSFTGEVKS